MHFDSDLFFEGYPTWLNKVVTTFLKWVRCGETQKIEQCIPNADSCNLGVQSVFSENFGKTFWQKNILGDRAMVFFKLKYVCVYITLSEVACQPT